MDLCALLHVDGRNGSPVQGVKKTNKHYSYRERLSLSYSSHELVNTMRRSSARALVRSHWPILGRKLARILSSNGSLVFYARVSSPGGTNFKVNRLVIINIETTIRYRYFYPMRVIFSAFSVFSGEIYFATVVK